MGRAGAAAKATTRRSASGKRNGLNSHASVTLKAATAAPMATASVARTTAANPGFRQQEPDCVANVARELVQPRSAPRVEDLLARRQRSGPQALLRCAARLTGRQPRPQAGFHLLLDVEAQFVVDVAIQARAAPDVPHARPSALPSRLRPPQPGFRTIEIAVDSRSQSRSSFASWRPPARVSE